MEHVDEDRFAAYFDLKLTPAETQELFAHVDSCTDCARLFSETAALHATQRPDLQQTAPDTGRAPEKLPKLGRYQVERMLGMGGMGVVYAGHDPELDRKVAIKLLQPQSHDSSATLRLRLQREAQAMAKLSHPNVVNVFEIGTFGDQVFVVMELVEGTTLGGWLRAGERPWREILHSFLAAGAGLEAAHQAGIVHRDFKPDNVLVGDGKIRVTDFGLAGRKEEAAPGGEARARDADLTYSGLVVGTPAYMAPEQMRGEPTDARTDVFSFCVALYEALAGVRPFAGKNLDDLRVAVENGTVQPPKKDVPRWLLRAVLRGLQASPAARWPSMAALLSALRADPSARRRRLVAAAVALVAAAAVAAGFWQLRQRARVCLGSEARLAGIWDPARKAKVHAAFTASGAPNAEVVWRTVEHTLDGVAGRWVAMSTASCEATRLKGTQSDALLDQRTRCLDDRLAELRAETDLFTAADRALVSRAVDAADSIADVERCADLASLAAELEPPRQAQKSELARLRQSIARANVLYHADRTADAEAMLPDILQTARATGYLAAEADALGLKGRLQLDRSQWDAAVATLQDAAVAGQRARADQVVLAAWLHLARTTGMQMGRIDEGILWSRYADALAGRIRVKPYMRGQILGNWAMMLAQAGRADEAVTTARRALAFDDGTLSEAESAGLRNTVAAALGSAGHGEEALGMLRVAAEQLAHAEGAEHTDVLITHLNLGGALNEVERYAEAAQVLEPSLATCARVRGGDDSLTADFLSNLADSERHLGRLPRAIEHAQRALVIYQQRKMDGLNLVSPLYALGEAERALGKAEAPATLARALSVGESAKLSADALAQVRFALAQALPARDHGRARELAKAARESFAGPGEAAARHRAEVDAWLAQHD